MTAGLVRRVRADRPRMLAAAGLFLAAVGDLAQGWDGPGPIVVAVVALVVLAVPRLIGALLAALTCVFFLLGAFGNPEIPAALSRGGAGAFAAATVQVLGFVIGLVGAGWWLARR